MARRIPQIFWAPDFLTRISPTPGRKPCPTHPSSCHCRTTHSLGLMRGRGVEGGTKTAFQTRKSEKPPFKLENFYFLANYLLASNLHFVFSLLDTDFAQNPLKSSTPGKQQVPPPREGQGFRGIHVLPRPSEAARPHTRTFFWQREERCNSHALRFQEKERPPLPTEK